MRVCLTLIYSVCLTDQQFEQHLIPKHSPSALYVPPTLLPSCFYSPTLSLHPSPSLHSSPSFHFYNNFTSLPIFSSHFCIPPASVQPFPTLALSSLFFNRSLDLFRKCGNRKRNMLKNLKNFYRNTEFGPRLCYHSGTLRAML